MTRGFRSVCFALTLVAFWHVGACSRPKEVAYEWLESTVSNEPQALMDAGPTPAADTAVEAGTPPEVRTDAGLPPRESVDADTPRAQRIDAGPTDPPLEAGAPVLSLQMGELREGSGDVGVEVVLSPAPDEQLVAHYELRDGEAQSDCQIGDYVAQAGEVIWLPGEQSASVNIAIIDDEVAELNETLELVFTGPPALAGMSLTLTIVDDDRNDVISSADFGVLADPALDQTTTLQAALDAAGAQAPSVLVIEPGEYLAAGLSVPAGVTISGSGATLRRGPNRPATEVSLHVHHEGVEDALPVLIENLTMDGLRDEQGPFQGDELNGAHLVNVDGDVATPGRARVFVENLALRFVTGSGINVGPNARVNVCHVQVTDAYREAVGILGGNSELDVLHLDATAALGTSGIRINPLPAGYGGSLTQRVSLRAVRLGSGDFEGELQPGSRLEMEEFRMGQPPFRLSAEGAAVRIRRSQIAIGVPSSRHNTVSGLTDTEVTETTFIASELIDESQMEQEASRTFGVLHIEQSATASEGALVLNECRFVTDGTIDADDVVYAVDAPYGDVVTIEGGSIESTFTDWFFPH